MTPATVRTSEPGPVAVIDVMILWSDLYPHRTHTDLGDPAVDLIDRANQVFLNSQARVRLRLVHAGKVAVPLWAGFDSWLSSDLLWERLAGTDDGWLDEVHPLRNQVKADLVILALPRADLVSWVAPRVLNEDQGFGVVIQAEPVEFARMVGHMLGCSGPNAPWETLGKVPQPGFFPDSHDLMLTNAPGVSTVMGSPDWLLTFSNPALVAYEQPLGVPGQADNVRTLDTRAPEVAAFRGGAGTVRAPSILWKSPRPEAVFSPGTSVTAEVVIDSPESAVQRVQFYEADPLTGLLWIRQDPVLELTEPPFRLVLSRRPTQWVHLVAVATDERGIATQSGVRFRFAPDNDAFDRRAVLTSTGGALPALWGGSSLEPGETVWAPSVAGSVWWTWTAPGRGTARFRVDVPGVLGDDWRLRAFRGTAVDSLVPLVDPAPLNEPIVLAVTGGEVVQLGVGLPRSVHAAGGDRRLVAEFHPEASNDRLAGAVRLEGREHFVQGSTVGMTGESDISSATALQDAATLWWTWTPPSDGLARFRLGTEIPSHWLWVFRGTASESFEVLATVEAGGSVVLPVNGGERLHLAVSAPNDPRLTGAFSFNVAMLADPLHATLDRRQWIAGESGAWPIGMPGPVEPGAPAAVQGRVSWWQWVAPATGPVLVHPGDPLCRVDVFTGNSLAALQSVPLIPAGGAGRSFEASVGTSYAIALSWTEIPAFLSLAVPQPELFLGYLAANDQLKDRVQLTGSSPEWTIPNLTGSLQPGEPEALAGSVWYSWRAPDSGRVSLRLQSAPPGMSVQAVVYRGTTVAGLTWVEGPGRVTPETGVEFVAIEGTEYSIAFHGGLDATAFGVPKVRLTLTPQPPPEGTRTNQTLLPPGPVVLPIDLTQTPPDPAAPQLPNAGTVLPSYWAEWRSPADGLVRFSTTGNHVGLYRTNASGGLRLVGFSYAGFRPSAVRVTAGELLRVVITGRQSGVLNLEWVPYWSNDSVEGRTAIVAVEQGDGAWRAELTAETHGATGSPNDPLSASNLTGHTRWWTFRPPVTGVVLIESQSTAPLHLEQFRVTAGGSLERVVYRQGTHSGVAIRFHAEAGREYPLAIDAVGGKDSLFSLSYLLLPEGQPSILDSFQDSGTLTGYSGRVRETLWRGTSEPGETGIGGQPPRHSLWWQWTAPDSGWARIRVRPDSQVAAVPWDSYPPGLPASPALRRVAVWIGSELGTLEPPDTLREGIRADAQDTVLEFAAIQGVTYRIAVDSGDGFDAEVGEFELEYSLSLGGDGFGQARPLSGELASLKGALTGATSDGWMPSGMPGLANRWWIWTAPRDLRATVHNPDRLPHPWAVFLDPYSAPMAASAAFPTGAAVSDEFVAIRGQTYLIAVYGDPNAVDAVHLELDALPVPSNDAFGGSLPLTGDRVQIRARAESASREPGEPVHGDAEAELPSLWWSWTAPYSGYFDLTSGDQPDFYESWVQGDQRIEAEFFVYSGSSLGQLTLLARSGTRFGFWLPSHRWTQFYAEAGRIYHLALCPRLEGGRLWSDAKYSLQFGIDPGVAHTDPGTANRIEGIAPTLSGLFRDGSRGLWWQWTAPDDGLVWVSPGAGLPFGSVIRPVVEAFRSTGGPEPEPVPREYGLGFWGGRATRGETWWIRVTGEPVGGEVPPYVPKELPFELTLSLERTAADNDHFERRTRLNGVAPVLNGHTLGATRESGEPIHGGLLGRGSLWWEWSVPKSGRWRVYRGGLNAHRLALGVYRGDRLDRLIAVPRMADVTSSFLFIEAVAGETLQFAVDNPTAEDFAFGFEIFLQDAPANDSFDSAVVVEGETPSWWTSSYGATAEPGERGWSGSRARASRWWQWTAPRSMDLLVRLNPTETSLVPAVIVFQGESLASLLQVADNRESGFPAEAFAFRVEGGVTYRFAVESEPGSSARHQVVLSPFKPPPNDSFDGRLPLTEIGRPAFTSNLGATLEAGEPRLAGPEVGASLWWSWRAPASGWATMSTRFSGPDTRLAVFKGPTLASLQLVAVNDDADQNPFQIFMYHSQVAFPAEEGVTYQIQMAGIGGKPGPIRLEWLGLDIPPAELSGVLPPESEQDAPRVLLRGTRGQQVWIYVSEELPYWNWVDSLTFGITGEATWVDTSRPAPMKFYRAESSP